MGWLGSQGEEDIPRVLDHEAHDSHFLSCSCLFLSSKTDWIVSMAGTRNTTPSFGTGFPYKYAPLVVLVPFFSHLRRNPVFTFPPPADCDLGCAMPDRRKVEKTRHRLSFDQRQSKSRSRRAEGNGKVEVFWRLTYMRWIPRSAELGFDHETTRRPREERDERGEGKVNRLRCDMIP